MRELSPPLTREIDGRIEGGLDVRLMWVVGTLLTYVTVTDYNEDPREYLFEVPEGVAPLDIFRNPFRFEETVNGAV